MKYVLTDKQKNALYWVIDNLIKSTFQSIIEDSEEWGLGEMHEFELVNSIKDIKINRIVTHTNIKVYVDIYTPTNVFDKEDYFEIISEYTYRISETIPNVQIIINDIILAEHN